MSASIDEVDRHLARAIVAIESAIGPIDTSGSPAGVAERISQLRAAGRLRLDLAVQDAWDRFVSPGFESGDDGDHRVAETDQGTRGSAGQGGEVHDVGLVLGNRSEPVELLLQRLDLACELLCQMAHLVLLRLGATSDATPAAGSPAAGEVA